MWPKKKRCSTALSIPGLPRPPERPDPPRGPRRGRRARARLGYAAGRPLPARVPGREEGPRLLRHLPDARAGLRDHPPADPEVPARRGNHLLRHLGGAAGPGDDRGDEAGSGKEDSRGFAQKRD